MSDFNVTRGRKRTSSTFSTSSTIAMEELSDAAFAPGHTGNLESGSVAIAGFWLHYEHSGFSPDPKASVQDEIQRLADSKGWSHKTMMKRRNEALAAEIALHDNGKTQLDRWQQLCVEVGVAEVGKIPKSISACKRVCFEDRGFSTC
jgi:hypothetical protein